MKDIRLLELSDGRVLVTTRAQGKVGGRGEIGWLILHSVDELNPQVFSSANLFEDRIYVGRMGRDQSVTYAEKWQGWCPVTYCKF